MTVGVPQAKAVTLVVILLVVQELALFHHHQALQHNLQKVMKTIFFLGMACTLPQKVVSCVKVIISLYF